MRAKLKEWSEYRQKSKILGTKLREKPLFVWPRGRRKIRTGWVCGCKGGKGFRNRQWLRASNLVSQGGGGLREDAIVNHEEKTEMDRAFLG